VCDHPGMGTARVVVGGVGHAPGLAGVAHALRDAGHEVVLVGDRQSPAQLVRTALAEDASRLVVAGGDEARDEAVRLLHDEDAADVEVVDVSDAAELRPRPAPDTCDQPNAREHRVNG
jgi:methylmalonyl-CoA mutase C-terminal domain/subunit